VCDDDILHGWTGNLKRGACCCPRTRLSIWGFDGVYLHMLISVCREEKNPLFGNAAALSPRLGGVSFNKRGGITQG